MKEETAAPFKRFSASLPEKDAPTTSSAIGVAAVSYTHLFFNAVNKAEDICLVAMFAAMVAAIFLQIIICLLYTSMRSHAIWNGTLALFQLNAERCLSTS